MSHRAAQQALAPSSEAVRVPTPQELRPRLFEEDPTFLGLLGAFTVGAALFLAWVTTSPLPERDVLVHIEDAVPLVRLPEHPRLVRVHSPDLILRPGPTAAPAPKPRIAQKPRSEATPDTRTVAEKSMLLQALLTHGKVGEDGRVDLLEDGARTADLDVSLREVEAPKLATRDAVVPKRGRILDDVTVTVDSHRVTPSAGIDQLQVSVNAERPTLAPEEGDTTQVPTVVRRYKGRIEACVQQALREDPKLDGRVVASWRITAGRVSEVQVDGDTHSATLESCVTHAVRTFRFDPSLTASVDAYPWIVSGQ